jgi:hypothetical protein
MGGLASQVWCVLLQFEHQRGHISPGPLGRDLHIEILAKIVDRRMQTALGKTPGNQFSLHLRGEIHTTGLLNGIGIQNVRVRMLSPGGRATLRSRRKLRKHGQGTRRDRSGRINGGGESLRSGGISHFQFLSLLEIQYTTIGVCLQGNF